MTLFVDKEAACAALAEGISRKNAALMLIYSLRAIAAHYDIALGTERVPTEVNPADAPSGDGQLSFTTEPSENLATLHALFSICDLSWVLPQHTS